MPRGNCRGELSHDWCPVSPFYSMHLPLPHPHLIPYLLTVLILWTDSALSPPHLFSHLHFMVWLHGGGRETGGLTLSKHNDYLIACFLSHAGASHGPE